MSMMSNYLENKLLDHVLRNVAYTPPTTVYVALYTASPTDADSGTEVTGGSYARQPITFNAASGGAVASAALVSFPVATANWGTITHVGIRDALTVGNLLFWGALASSKVINTGDRFDILAGSATVSLD